MPDDRCRLQVFPFKVGQWNTRYHLKSQPIWKLQPVDEDVFQSIAGADADRPVSVSLVGSQVASDGPADASGQQNKDRVHPDADPQGQPGVRAELRQQRSDG